MEGRKSLCFKCRQKGHIRPDSGLLSPKEKVSPATEKDTTPTKREETPLNVESIAGEVIINGIAAENEVGGKKNGKKEKSLKHPDD